MRAKFFAAKSKYLMLSGGLLAAVLACFWLIDCSYVTYWRSVDCEPLPAEVPLAAEYQTDRD